jgi:hypothetical protein
LSAYVALDGIVSSSTGAKAGLLGNMLPTIICANNLD